MLCGVCAEIGKLGVVGIKGLFSAVWALREWKPEFAKKKPVISPNMAGQILTGKAASVFPVPLDSMGLKTDQSEEEQFIGCRLSDA